MAKRKKLSYPPIRQDVNMAIYAIEFFEKRTDPEVRKMVDRLLKIDSDLNGEHSIEFLQSYFSAIMFMRQWLSNAECPEPFLKLVSAFSAELARHYVDKLEATVRVQGRLECRR